MNKKSTSGFTLTEMLVSVGIFGIVVAVIYSFFMVGIGSWEIGSVRTDLQSQSRIAMDAMIQELKNSTRTKYPTRSISIQSQNNPNDTINFYLPTVDPGTGMITSWPRYVTYQHDPSVNQLIRSEGANQRVLCHNVASIQFIDAGIDSSLYINEVNILLNLQKTTPRGRNINFTMNSTVKLRN